MHAVVTVSARSTTVSLSLTVLVVILAVQLIADFDTVVHFSTKTQRPDISYVFLWK